MAKKPKSSDDLTANILRILKEIEKRVTTPEHEDAAQEWAESLDSMLDEMKNNDQFGSEASTDPRGDFRNGEWSMWECEA